MSFPLKLGSFTTFFGFVVARYTKALGQLPGGSTPATPPTMSSTELGSIEKLSSVILCNRAAAAIMLGLFHRAVQDCTEAIRLQPTYVKVGHSGLVTAGWSQRVRHSEQWVRHSGFVTVGSSQWVCHYARRRSILA